MDTTEKYILMCEESKKDIGKKEELWDWYYDKESKTVEVVVRLNTRHPMGNNYHKDEIPLYRQDQLQAMVGQDFIGLIERLLKWVEDPWGFGSMPFKKDIGKLSWWTETYIPQFETWDQLLLAFVMYEKYQKMWSEQKCWCGISTHSINQCWEKIEEFGRATDS